MGQLRVLVVEDEPLVAMLHEDLIGLAGHVTIAIPENHEAAVLAADMGVFDLALIDAEIWGREASLVVAAVQRRNKPIIVCSGHAPGDLPEALKGFVTLSKPYALSDLAAVLADVSAAA